jgi:hypothetical protein
MLRQRNVAMLAGSLLAAAALQPAHAADLAEGLRGPDRAVWGPAYVNGVPVSYGYGLCYQQQLLLTPWGPRWRLVNRCY